MMRVAIVATYPAGAVLPPDQIKARFRGREHASSWVRALCLALRDRGRVECRVFAHSRAVNRTRAAECEGIQFEFIPKVELRRTDPLHFYLPGQIQIRARLRAFAPDLIYAFGIETGNAAIALAQRCAPTVVFVQGIMSKIAPHMGLGFLKRLVFRKLEAQAARLAAGVVVESEFARRWITTLNPNARLRVIPHALNPEFLRVQADLSTPSVLCVASLGPHKGADVVLRALAHAQRADWSLTMIGDMLPATNYPALAQQLGVSGRVEFTGLLGRADIIRRMASARACVLGSRMDTSPNAITEAHAVGLPVVASAVGGIPDMVVDGIDGFLVPVDDPRAMAAKLDFLVGRPDVARAMGQAGRDKVLRLNDPARIAALHEEFFGEILLRRA